MRFSSAYLVLSLLAVTHTAMGQLAEEQKLQRAGLAGIPIKPSVTDAAIQDFDSPHYIFVDRSIILGNGPSAARDRHELFLYLTGTGGTGRTAVAFCRLAARNGYRVINLMYPINSSGSSPELH